ncbi:uncharacterized protein PHACADRAFT_246931 [Phanerochaete carnosa HHB-10118-sp]|uniref:Tricalbin n=1 Tax=Phanerochaete carnosa (strain HHB-10118-sp) TaxID=650164 RepID=K5WMZ4_PHACS|nr:uncharacterized protein PHACADRAFT_246931 [Phanerochaete carnosa HHB-10118-sp]EKM60795.1 hypothetical protein PHACADRAFT_246931 [Phanerochaete carnosa HHB-10118-sp]
MATDGAVPDISVTPPDAQAQLHAIAAKDAAKGQVPVYTFNPNASPEAKAAEAGKGREKLKSGKDDVGNGGVEVQVDTGNPNVVPTITIDDVDKVAAEEPLSALQQQPPGAMPAGAAPPIPDWYKVGWRAISGVDNSALPEGEVKDKTVLDAFLKEQFYGDWYHNAAIIVVVIIVTHFLTRFHFGWGWLFIVLAFCSTYYTTSMARLRSRARDDIQRELMKTRLMDTHESAEWINNFLDRFWLIYEPVLSQTIVATVDQILSTNCPPFLDSLRMTQFTLGNKAPRIIKVKTYPGTPDDIVLMDWGLSFSPNDISDLTPKQLRNKVNPKIVISVRVGKGIAAAAMPILLEDMSFSGLLRVRIKLMTAFPHAQVVDLSFMEKPTFDYVLKPLGGETFGFDIANVPGLSAFIRNMVHSILGPMMYDPNFFTLNIEQMLSGEPLDSAIGVLQVTIQSARGLKGSKIGGGTPDPYVSLSINQRAELAHTKCKRDTVNPAWMETKFILVNNLTETLNLSVLDYNDHRKDTEMGFATFDLAKLRDDATWEGVEAPVQKDGKERGTIRFDVSFFPVLKPGTAGIEEILDSNVGIVRLTIHQAKDLDQSKSITGDLNPMAKVFLGNGQVVHKTQKFKRTNNPVWESTTEFLCSDKSTSTVTVRVIDDRDFLKDPVIGHMTVRLGDLLEAKKEVGRDWWPLSGCASGAKLRVSAEWKPLNMAGSLHGADQYVPPIGVVRVWLKKAQDVKNVEATLGGKSDPYVRVQINNITLGRTEVVNNNLSPEWDQIVYIPVHSLKETMMLECMDYQHLTKDRTLGLVELKVSDLAEPVEGSQTYSSKGKQIREDPIKLDKGTYKGKLFYEAQFVPAMPVKNVKFNSGPNAIERAVQGNDDLEGDDISTHNSSESEKQDVPDGITVSAPLDEDEQVQKGHRKTGSTDTTKTANTTRTADTQLTRNSSVSNNEKRPEDDAPEMSPEELLQHQSGVIIFNVISGQLRKKARLEVLLDDAYWPAFSTVRARSQHVLWEYIGEGFVKELDFGQVWLRLNDADEGEKDEIIAEYKGSAKDFLQKTLTGSAHFTLHDIEDDNKTCTVEIETRYVPVSITLEPRESVNNQGIMNVTLINGRDIHAADRGGKSDPFVVFSLNGQKVHKSQTKKKTVNPDWNEQFVVQVPSRVGSSFTLEVFDWNQIEQAKSLGLGTIDLESLEPFVGVEKTVPLSHHKHGDKGSIKLMLTFRPEIIAKARKNTSTFSTAGRAMTQIGHLPVGAGKGVIHGVTGVFKRGNSSDSDDDKASIKDAAVVAAAQTPSGQATVAQNGTTLLPVSASFPQYNGTGTGGASTDPGTLKITVLDAKDLSMNDAKPYVTVRVGDKEHKTKHVKSATPEWQETFSFAAGPSQSKLHVWVLDHKTLGKDKPMGSGEVDIWRHLQPGVSGSADVMIELREGQGQLRLRLDFDAERVSLRNRASMSSIDGRTSPTSTAPSRFSLNRRREKDD